MLSSLSSKTLSSHASRSTKLITSYDFFFYHFKGDNSFQRVHQYGLVYKLGSMKVNSNND